MNEQEKNEMKVLVEDYVKNLIHYDYEISDDLRKSLLMAEFSDKNVIVSGSAGTGKSTFIELFLANTKKRHAVVAPTGVAAVNIGGVTIHSFLKMAHGVINKYAIPSSMKEIVMNLDVLIIDEISMVRADLMDAIDYQFRTLTQNADRPFGGIKIIAVGDLFQLPPIVQRNSPDEQYIKDNFYSPWFFSAPDIGKFTIVELNKVYRQSTDVEFKDILNKIRVGKQTWDDLKVINKNVVKEEDFGDDYIYLSTTNKVADKVNSDRMRELKEKSHFFHSTSTGDFPQSSYPAPAILELKVGCQIMMIRNTDKFYNGEIGSVISLSDNHITVQLEGGGQVDVKREQWINGEYELKDGKVSMREKGSFFQYPLKLAYAITIHKSQSKTYSKIYIDLGQGAFSAGQTYVALSRCKTLDGIGLKYKIDKRDIIVDRVLKEHFLNT